MTKELLSQADLILNKDGSIYHLKLHPEEVASTVILVGDPKRVSRISRHFDSIELKRANREFVTHTGHIGRKRLSVISTGIGPDNIDIVMNELDALVNVDLNQRIVRDRLSSLQILRLGTSGSLQPGLDSGTMVLAEYGLGLDGTMAYYKGRKGAEDRELTAAFIKQTGWSGDLPAPYIIAASPGMIRKMDHGARKGITATAAGFYGPQGRKIRLDGAFPGMLERMGQFMHKGMKVLNFEMETATLYGLGKLLGHEMASLCVILANRVENKYSRNNLKDIDQLIDYALVWITK